MFSKKDKEDKSSPKPKTVKETKCTCNACGKVWHFGKEEVWQDQSQKMGTAALVLACPCCGGCLAPFMKGRQDPKQCPQCHSKNVTTEEVSYEVGK